MKSIAYGDQCVNRSPVPAAQSRDRAVVSMQLMAANKRLLAQREQRQAQSEPAPTPSVGKWGGALFAVARGDADAVEVSAEVSPLPPPASIVVHPTLLLAMLKQEQVAFGRIWLLAKLLDTSGRGWLSIQQLRGALTQKQSAHYVCGWRRLRQILAQGSPLFWQRDDANRLFLHSAARVTADLGVTHLAGDAIELPAVSLLGTIGDVRATFYTTFHSGRDSAPISRATLCQVTSIPERTQRHYDNVQQTERIYNFSLLSQQGDAETAWQHGRAAFNFTDKQGHHGTAGHTYTAIRLPNSYETTRYARLTRKRKRLNKQLKQVLAQRGMQGNSNSSARRLFFTDAQQAANRFKQSNKFGGVQGTKQQDDCYLHHKCQNSRSFWIRWES